MDYLATKINGNGKEKKHRQMTMPRKHGSG